jgi:pimeloyl-ACP methyl ester carboxylesterase
MMRAIAACGLLLIPALSLAADPPPRLLPARSFGVVTVYTPAAAPQSVAIFLSGDGGWNLGVVYAALVQSPPGTFAGAISLGFCPDQDFGGAAPCPGAGLRYLHGKKNDLIFEPAKTLRQPWIALQGEQDQVCSPAAVDDFGAQTAESQVIKLPKVGHGFGVDPTRPELASVRSTPVLCIYGSGEQDSICPTLPAARVKSEEVGTGHHFGGEYDRLADRILAFAKSARPMT